MNVSIWFQTQGLRSVEFLRASQELTVPVPTWQEFMDVVFKTHESGGGVYVLLWLFLFILLIFNVVQFRIHRTHTTERVQELEQAIDEYEKKYSETSSAFDDFRKRYARLQKKLSIVTGMMISMLGSRKLPDGFWAAMMNDDSEIVPTIPDKIEVVTIPAPMQGVNPQP